MLERAVDHLGKFSGSGEWLSVATVLILAALYIEGRGSSSPSELSFTGVEALVNAANVNFSTYSPEARMRLCELLAAPLVYNGHYAWGRFYRSEADQFKVDSKKLANAAIRTGFMWASVGLPRMSILDVGLVRGWLSWHKDFWLKTPDDYVAGVNISQSSHESKIEAALNFVSHAGVDDSLEVSSIAQEFCRYLGLLPTDVLQIHRARCAGSSRYSQTQVAWLAVSSDQVLVHLESETKTRTLKNIICSGSVYFVTGDIEVDASLWMYSKVLAKVLEPGTWARTCIDAVNASGVNFERTLGGYNLQKPEYIGGSYTSYSISTSFQKIILEAWKDVGHTAFLGNPISGHISVVLDNIRPTSQLAAEIAAATNDIVLKPLLGRVYTKVAELLPAATALSAYCTEIARMLKLKELSSHYRYSAIMAPISDCHADGYVARALAGMSDDRTVSQMVAEAICAAESVAYHALLSGLTTKKTSNEEKLTAASVSFGD
jgi:hypothetical protein